MSIVKDGIPFIIVPALLGIIIFFLSANVYVRSCGVLLILLGLFCAYFFRDPSRKLVTGKDFIVSPADGTVLEVGEENGKKFIRIFLSVFNVHLQRAPVEGIVKKVEYRPGKFLPAMVEKAHIDNEQNVITIETKSGEIVVKQIAGLIARRVVSWVKPEQNINQGDKIGFIKFGSQVDIIIPATCKINVEKDQKVTAGITVLALKD